MKQKIIRTFIAAVLLWTFNIATYAAPPLSSIQRAKTIVEDARYQLPVDTGFGMMLTQISYDSKTYSLVYRYHTIVPVPKPTSEAIKEAKLGVIHLLKANPNSEEMQLIKSGITFHYNYYSSDGTFLYAIKLTPYDFK